jgi:hypothetical protein
MAAGNQGVGGGRGNHRDWLLASGSRFPFSKSFCSWSYNEFDIFNKVQERGWILSAYSMPPDAQEIRGLRIVVRPHLNQEFD